MKQRLFFLFTLMSVILSACASSGTATTEPVTVELVMPELPTSGPVKPEPTEMEVTMPFVLTSSAFGQGEPIPERYSCKGEDISPALAWDEPPAGTQSFTLIMDDPDAPFGTWVHWLLFNIPASTRDLPEAFPSDAALPDGSMSGKSSSNKTGYGGPCPPSGTHRYFFKLYALDEMLAISAGADKGELEKAMTGHILAQVELMGTFTK
jgi:Raf kinase inhibitor-like YbhB/YbcL family protein